MGDKTTFGIGKLVRTMDKGNPRIHIFWVVRHCLEAGVYGISIHLHIGNLVRIGDNIDEMVFRSAKTESGKNDIVYLLLHGIDGNH